MSPQLALASEVFWFYAIVVVTLLVLAGVALAVLRVRGRNVQHAWQAYRGWLILVPLLMLCIFLGRGPAIVFFTAVALFVLAALACCFEWGPLQRRPWITAPRARAQGVAEA